MYVATGVLTSPVGLPQLQLCKTCTNAWLTSLISSRLALCNADHIIMSTLFSLDVMFTAFLPMSFWHLKAIKDCQFEVDEYNINIINVVY